MEQVLVKWKHSLGLNLTSKTKKKEKERLPKPNRLQCDFEDEIL